VPAARGLLAAALLAAGAAGAQPAADPDWPCVQRKVPSLTPAVVWAGPPFEAGALDWEADAEVAALVARLSQRRVAEEDAAAEVEAFAADAGDDRLLLLFAGLFETMDRERSAVMEGIGRYARRQIAEAEEIRMQASALETHRAGMAPEALAGAEEALTWRIRVFDERRDNLAYACEVPRLVEQRLFALGRAIAGEIEGG
jgi:hypothetical protein